MSKRLHLKEISELSLRIALAQPLTHRVKKIIETTMSSFLANPEPIFVSAPINNLYDATFSFLHRQGRQFCSLCESQTQTPR